MLLERVLPLPPRDVIAEGLVRLHGTGWRVVTLSEHHVELVGERPGPTWPFVVFPLAALVGHFWILFGETATGAFPWERLGRYGIIAWPLVAVGLFAYHFARGRPPAMTLAATPVPGGTRLIARADGSTAAREDLDYFLDHLVTVVRERMGAPEDEAGKRA